MGQGPVATRRHVDFAWIGLGIGDELRNRPGWNRRIDLHGERRANGARDRRDVTDEIEIELVIERCVTRVRRHDYEERIAVRGCPHDGLRADIAAGAWPVVDNERLTKALR